MAVVENFVDEIDFSELELIEIVGRGAFGVVTRAIWKGINVAVKHIETESERKAFITELTQLSRVSHPNIVHLHGACTITPVCLVMEYAEGGSLYNVLHEGGPNRAIYSLAHALSWCLQCAKGVEYLHGMKPKALIHRDLKPPNLLLVQGGTLLKICDFGTACDIHTHMTENKGSAAWMAPEVFETSNYSEKCDVYSWGIILWEVLTRRKPFEEIGGSAYRILWAVHQGTRPPLIQKCPKPIGHLMTKCWAGKAVERPSMGEVVRVMNKISQFSPGADEPILYPNTPETPPTAHAFDACPPTFKQDTVRHEPGEPVRVAATARHTTKHLVEEGKASSRMTSAPASLAASVESLQEKSSRSSTPSVDYIHKRYSADLSRLDTLDFLGAHAAVVKGPPVRGHRRTGSHGTAIPQCVPPKAPAGKGHRRTGSYGNSPLAVDVTAPPTGAGSGLHHVTTAPANLGSNLSLNPPEISQRSYSWAPSIGGMAPMNPGFESLEVQLRPLDPCQSNQESLDIYHDHYNMAQHYLQVQLEIHQLTEKKRQLEAELEHDKQQHENKTRFINEYAQLQRENEDLQQFYDNLKRQAEMLLPPDSRASASTT